MDLSRYQMHLYELMREVAYLRGRMRDLQQDVESKGRTAVRKQISTSVAFVVGYEVVKSGLLIGLVLL